MASIAFPSLAKSVKLPSGTTYSYVWSPPSDSKPTILFVHGFPSSSFDWRHQISFFKEKKYGVLVPDLLGYGGTDQPHSPEPYKMKTIATDVVAILDHEKLEKVHGVGHDFGSIQLGRILNHFPERLLSCSFLAVPYTPPGQPFDLNLLKGLTEQMIGFEKFGYMRFMEREDSGDVIDAHADSVSSVLYSGSEEMGMHFFPAGALEAWMKSDRTAPLDPRIMTKEEKKIRDRIFAKESGGYRGPTNWYRVLVRDLNAEDEKGLDPRIPCPVLLIVEKDSSVTIPGFVEGMAQFAEDFRMKTVSTIGHWVQLEARDEVNQILEEFLDGMKS